MFHRHCLGKYPLLIEFSVRELVRGHPSFESNKNPINIPWVKQIKKLAKQKMGHKYFNLRIRETL